MTGSSLVHRLRAEAHAWDRTPDAMEAIRAPHYIMREAAEELEQIGGVVSVLQQSNRELSEALNTLVAWWDKGGAGYPAFDAAKTALAKQGLIHAVSAIESDGVKQ